MGPLGWGETVKCVKRVLRVPQGTEARLVGLRPSEAVRSFERV